MSILNVERISVQPGDDSVRLKTEIFAVQTEEFPSVEKAIQNRQFQKLKDYGSTAFWGAGGAAAVFQGIGHIISGVKTSNIEEIIIGL